ncbi:LisH domain-containing protein armc9 [Phlyctochytrium bullatum]|nr:LisH domain-containing protein armc9 [Phlyctochytrium bullatum]
MASQSESFALHDGVHGSSKIISRNSHTPPTTTIDIEDGSAPSPSVVITETVRLPLSRSQFWLVFLGLALSIFLAALDQTIVATALEKLVKELGQQELIPWIGSGYLLTETSAAAIYGKLADIFGRRLVFIFALFAFVLGSVHCAAAPSMLVLILGRVIAGVGGGGIVSLVLIIISDMVTSSEASKYQGMLAAVFGLSSVIGPLAGGAFSDNLSWRWCFWINLPFGAVAMLTAWLFLKFPTVEGESTWREKLGRVDWLGAVLLTAGVSCLITPVYVAKEPIIPASLFTNHSVTPLIIIAFCLGSTFLPVLYYVSLFFQVALGQTATDAGLMTIPLILGLVVLSIASGQIHSRTGFYVPFIYIGPLFIIAGISLVSTLSNSSTLVQQIFYLMIAGVGCGSVSQVRISGLLVSIDPDRVAVATAVSQFSETLGGTIGAAITGTIFNNMLAKRLAASPTIWKELDGQDPAKVNLPILREMLVIRGETEVLDELRATENLNRLGLKFTTSEVAPLFNHDYPRYQVLSDPELCKEEAMAVLTLARNTFKSATRHSIFNAKGYCFDGLITLNPKSKIYYVFKRDGTVLAGKVYSSAESESYFREIESLGCTPEHPNIVKLHDSFIHENKHILILDFFPRSVSDMMRVCRPLPVELLEIILRDCTAALDHLHANDYPTSLNAFDLECRLKGRSPLKGSDPYPNADELIEQDEAEDAQMEFLVPFREGDRDAFFSLWDARFPESLRSSDPLYQRMEFQLNIYFAIFPIHPYIDPLLSKVRLDGFYSHKRQKRSLQKSMEAFKHFLETRGADLCKTTQFLSFYALPYVPDPKVHPSFGELFAERYLSELEDRFRHFLTMALKAVDTPKLLNMLYARITTSYLSGICQRLAFFKKARKANPAPEQKAPEEMERKTPSPANQRPMRSSSSSSKSPSPLQGPGATRPPLPDTEPSSPRISDIETAMDYERLKQDLASGGSVGGGDGLARLQTLVLQALRFNMLKNQRGRHRRQVAKTYIQHDFLGLRSSASVSLVNPSRLKVRKIITSIFSSESSYPKEQLGRLLNVIATDCAGRDYILASGSQAISTLFTALRKEEGDSLLFQNIIGTLQKLSLRRSTQSFLNRLNAIEFLVERLESFDTYSEYSVEYCLALLMNLCLRTAGRKQCLKDPTRVIAVLADLLSVENTQIHTYVNGTLYSLLSEPELRMAARDIRLDEILEELCDSGKDDLKGQIEYVLDQMVSDEAPGSDTFSDDGEEEDREDNEEGDGLYDEEEDTYETIFELAPGETSREQLLIQRYCTRTNPSRTSNPSSRRGSPGMSNGDPLPPVTTSRRHSGGLAGAPPPPQFSKQEPAVRTSLPVATLSNMIAGRKGLPNGTAASAVDELRRPKTPNSRPITPNSPARGPGGPVPRAMGGVYASTSSAPLRGAGVTRESMQGRGTARSKDDSSTVAATPISSAKPQSSSLEQFGPGPVVVKTSRGKAVPSTQAEIQEFNFGFSSKPKIPRTPDH